MVCRVRRVPRHGKARRHRAPRRWAQL